MSHATIYQDNKSAILLENNGKMSSKKGGTKHVKMKYYFITDRVQHGEVVVEHMPTEQMWIDVNTKPKQGRPFRVDRSAIMGCPIDLPSSIATMVL